VATPSFDEIIIAWRASFGGRIPVNSEERKSCIRDLFATLESYEMLEDVKIKSNQNRIVNASVNPTSKKLSNWKAAVEVDIQVIMQEKFEEIKILKASDTDFKIKTPEHKPYVAPPPVVAAAPFVNPGYTKPTKRVVANPDWEPTTVQDKSVWDELGLKEDE